MEHDLHIESLNPPWGDVRLRCTCEEFLSQFHWEDPVGRADGLQKYVDHLREATQ